MSGELATGRTITDADAAAVAKALKAEFAKELRNEAGKGLLDLVKKGLFWIVLLLALHGLGVDRDVLANVAGQVTK